MVNPSNPRSNDNSTDEEITVLEPLGIRAPLLPPKPLGQTLLQPKFLSPLGATPLSGLDASASVVQEMPDYSLVEPFPQNNPLLTQSPTFNTVAPTPVQRQAEQLGEISDAIANPSNTSAIPTASTTGESTTLQRSLETQPILQEAPEVAEPSSLSLLEITGASSESAANSTTPLHSPSTTPIVQRQPAQQGESTLPNNSQSSETTVQRQPEAESSATVHEAIAHTSVVEPVSFPESTTPIQANILQPLSAEQSSQPTLPKTPESTATQIQLSASNVIYEATLQETEVSQTSLTASVSEPAVVQRREDSLITNQQAEAPPGVSQPAETTVTSHSENLISASSDPTTGQISSTTPAILPIREAINNTSTDQTLALSREESSSYNSAAEGLSNEVTKTQDSNFLQPEVSPTNGSGNTLSEVAQSVETSVQLKSETNIPSAISEAVTLNQPGTPLGELTQPEPQTAELLPEATAISTNPVVQAFSEGSSSNVTEATSTQLPEPILTQGETSSESTLIQPSLELAAPTNLSAVAVETATPTEAQTAELLPEATATSISPVVQLSSESSASKATGTDSSQHSEPNFSETAVSLEPTVTTSELTVAPPFSENPYSESTEADSLKSPALTEHVVTSTSEGMISLEPAVVQPQLDSSATTKNESATSPISSAVVGETANAFDTAEAPSEVHEPSLVQTKQALPQTLEAADTQVQPSADGESNLEIFQSVVEPKEQPVVQAFSESSSSESTAAESPIAFEDLDSTQALPPTQEATVHEESTLVQAQLESAATPSAVVRDSSSQTVESAFNYDAIAQPEKAASVPETQLTVQRKQEVPESPQPAVQSPVVELVVPPLVQREEPAEPTSEQDKLKEGAKKVGEAFLETKVGKKLKEDAAKLGKDFVSSTEGKVITGAAAVGAITGIIAANAELPMQVPEIPLDVVAPGLKMQLTYEGPVQKPTKAMITFTFTTGGSSDQKPALTEADNYRAETARLAAEQEKFKKGLKYSPGSPEDLAAQAEERANQAWIRSQLKLPSEQAEDFLNDFRKKYPGLSPSNDIPPSPLKLKYPGLFPSNDIPPSPLKLEYPGLFPSNDILSSPLKLQSEEQQLMRKEAVAADAQVPEANDEQANVSEPEISTSASQVQLMSQREDALPEIATPQESDRTIQPSSTPTPEPLSEASSPSEPDITTASVSQIQLMPQHEETLPEIAATPQESDRTIQPSSTPTPEPSPEVSSASSPDITTSVSQVQLMPQSEETLPEVATPQESDRTIQPSSTPTPEPSSEVSSASLPDITTSASQIQLMPQSEETLPEIAATPQESDRTIQPSSTPTPEPSPEVSSSSEPEITTTSASQIQLMPQSEETLPEIATPQESDRTIQPSSTPTLEPLSEVSSPSSPDITTASVSQIQLMPQSEETLPEIATPQESDRTIQPSSTPTLEPLSEVSSPSSPDITTASVSQIQLMPQHEETLPEIAATPQESDRTIQPSSTPTPEPSSEVSSASLPDITTSASQIKLMPQSEETLPEIAATPQESDRTVQPSSTPTPEPLSQVSSPSAPEITTASASQIQLMPQSGDALPEAEVDSPSQIRDLVSEPSSSVQDIVQTKLDSEQVAAPTDVATSMGDTSLTSTVETLSQPQDNNLETQIGTDSDVTVAQLFSEAKQTPVLPTVLENLGQSNPLGQSSSLGQPSVEATATSPLISRQSSSSLSTEIAPMIQRMPDSSVGDSSEITLNQQRISDRISKQAELAPMNLSSLSSSSATNSNIDIQQVAPISSIISRQESQDAMTQVAPSTDIPTSWSSIADLLGGSNSVDSQSSIIQGHPEHQQSIDSQPPVIQRHQDNGHSDSKAEDLVFTPEGFRRGDSPVASSTSKARRSLIQTKKRNSTSSYPIQKKSLPSAMDNTESANNEVTISRQISPQEDDSYNLEILAQEIYSLVQQRLQIEQERHGRHYSGRLPW